MQCKSIIKHTYCSETVKREIVDFHLQCLFSADVEKRQNPVCHFVTPLDGNMDSGVHRPTEVRLFAV